MKPIHYIPPILIVLTAAIGLASSDPDGQHRKSEQDRLVPEAGEVTFVEGRVEVKRSSGWIPLLVGDRVLPGDSVRSSDAGRTELTWNKPERVVRAERGSLIGLSGETRGRDIRFSVVSVERGAVWAKVVGSPGFELRSSGIESRIGTATAALRVKEGTDRLAVFTGAVEANGYRLTDGKGLAAKAGQSEIFAVASDDDLRDGWQDVVRDESPAVVEQIEPPRTRQLTRDLRDLNPDVYLGVEVELTGRGASCDEFETDEARIRKIRVRSSSRDGLGSDRKVRLLNDTFAVLKARYPGILETVVLEFDDNRPRLSLKYAAAG